jgi:hypothetical protein
MSILKSKLAFAASACFIAAVVSGESGAAVSMKIVQGASCAASAAPIPITTAGGPVALSVCVSASVERVCSATYPLISSNAAATAAAVQAASRTPDGVFTNVLDVVAFPATISATPTPLANGVPAAGAQVGGTGADIKIASLALTVPAGLPAATSFAFAVDVSGEIATVPVATASCNDLAVTQDSNPVGTVQFTLATPGAATPSVSVAASPATLVDAAANVATVTFTASAAAPAGGLSVAFTPPTAGGLIASTTCTSPIAIAAGNTTATCTVTAAVNTVPGDGPTVGTTTVIAGTGYTVGAPASATVTVNNDDVAPGTPVVTIAAAPATLVDAAGNVATVTVTSSLVAPATGLVVNLTPAAASARYTTTCGATITIPAGATTATCTVTAVANTVLADGSVTATTTLAAPAAGYTLGAATSAAVAVNNDDFDTVIAVTPVTPAGALLLPSYAPGATPGRSTTALNFNVTGGAGALACVAAGAGYTATPNPLNLVVGTAGTVTVTYTGTAAGTFTGTLTCTSTAPATGGPFVYNLSTTVADAVIPASVPVPTMGALGLGLMSLLVAGFAGFAQRRRLGK